jgi:hypothetical protein
MLDEENPFTIPPTTVDPVLKSKIDGPPKGFKPPDAKPRVAPPVPTQPQGGGKDDGATKS